MRTVEDHFWWYAGLRHMLRLSVLRFCKTKRPRVLDAGCGTGANLKLLSTLLPEGLAVGFDYSPLAAGLASERKLNNVMLADIHRIPLEENCFDLCVSCDVLGQRGIDWKGALRELHRVLKPGGLLFLNLPAFTWLKGDHDVAAHVDRRFDPRELRELLVTDGFEVEYLTCWNFCLLPLLWIRRFLQRLRRQHEVEGQSDLAEMPGWANAILRTWITTENSIASRLRFPIGTSVFAVARKE